MRGLKDSQAIGDRAGFAEAILTQLGRLAFKKKTKLTQCHVTDKTLQVGLGMGLIYNRGLDAEAHVPSSAMSHCVVWASAAPWSKMGLLCLGLASPFRCVLPGACSLFWP